VHKASVPLAESFSRVSRAKACGSRATNFEQDRGRENEYGIGPRTKLNIILSEVRSRTKTLEKTLGAYNSCALICVRYLRTITRLTSLCRVQGPQSLAIEVLFEVQSDLASYCADIIAHIRRIETNVQQDGVTTHVVLERLVASTIAYRE
jgi:hypothetical protein